MYTTLYNNIEFVITLNELVLSYYETDIERNTKTLLSEVREAYAYFVFRLWFHN